MTLVKLLNGDLIDVGNIDDITDVRESVTQMIKDVPQNRLKLTRITADSYALFIQPEVHPYASEFRIFCGNLARFLRDEIFDYLDLDGSSKGFVLSPPKSFQNNWDKYFDQFPKFFSDEGNFSGTSVIYYTSNADPVNAFEVFKETCTAQEDRASSNWYLREYLPLLLPALSFDEIRVYRSTIWQEAVRQAYTEKYACLNDMVVMTNVSFICGLTNYLNEHDCQDDNFRELQEAPDLFPDANAFMNRVSQESEIGWDVTSMSAVLRYFINNTRTF